MNFRHLAQPCRIGSLEIKNRMAVTAMGVNLAEADGSCGDKIIAFHERQAKGGAGLIILGVPGVAWPDGGNQPRQIAISEDRHIPGLKTMAEAIHAYDAKVIAQIHHGGMVSAQDMKEGRAVWIPSYPKPADMDLFDHMLPHEMNAFFDPEAPPINMHVMTKEDIEILIAKYAAAAARAKEAGIDGVEIHAGHGYMISGFLSPSSNTREDEYGGSFENRARLLVEIIAAVRQEVGGDFPISCKLDSKEYGKDSGITIEDAIATAKLVQDEGVNAVTVTAYHDAGRGALHSESHTPHLPDHNVKSAAAIKQAIDLPVIASGRIEPESADQFIGSGRFDVVSMGRKVLADPDLPNKIMAGAIEKIRPCVYCYCCISQIYVLKQVKCAVNPETGYEQERQLIATDQPRRIAVVGGGPAGMEAALRLNERGHRVSLFDSGKKLGGTLAFASIAYEPNGRLLHWLRQQVADSNIEVHLETTVTVALMQSMGVDEIVVATGAERAMPAGIPGSDQEIVYSGEEMRALVMTEPSKSVSAKTSLFTRLMVKAGALTGITGNAELTRQATRFWMPLGKQIVIIGGELVGLELAEFLVERGRELTVLENSGYAGKGLYIVRRMRLMDELKALGVHIVKSADQVEIGDQEVSYTAADKRQTVRADHVIVAQGATGNTDLADALRSAGFTTHTIGDCNGVSYIEGAMESAAELAVSI